MPEFDPLPSYTVRIHRLDPTLAELHIQFADLPANVEVRGRLIGPCCPGSSTIEVAYQLRKMPGSTATFKVLIPEPVFWTPDRHCVYEGPVEFWRTGEALGTITICVGVKSVTA